MRFSIRMAVRELRASWRRLILFFVCVAIGVGSIVILRSVIQNVEDVLTKESKALLAADVVIRSNRPWSDSQRHAIETLLSENVLIKFTETVDLATIVRPRNKVKISTRTVELRAVDEGFPYYGDVEVKGLQRYTYLLLKGKGVLVRPELLAQLNVEVGEEIVIGNAPFTITGVIESEPGRRIGLFSFGPRVFVHLKDLRELGLLDTGSRARHRMLFRVPPSELDSFVTQLREEFREDFVRIRTYRDREDRIGSNFQRAENYFSLVGFVVVVLGGIGVWSVTRSFVQQKLKSISVLKCLGATTLQIITMYVIQAVFLGITGSLLGVVIAFGIVAFVPENVVSVLGPISYGLTWSAIIQGFGIGVMVSLLFSFVPLFEIRHIKPLLLFRRAEDDIKVDKTQRCVRERLVRSLLKIDWPRLTVIVAATTVLFAIASWQAASLESGFFVCGGLVGVALILNSVGALLIRVVAPLESLSWFPLRHAVMCLTRPGNQARVILLAVGLGSFFIIGVRALQSNLLAELDLEQRSGDYDMVLLDIQEDQLKPVNDFLLIHIEKPATMIPVTRARVVGVSGQEINLEDLEDVRGQGSLGRDYTVTYREHLKENEEVVDGRFLSDKVLSHESEVSIEESLHERFNINIGDLMRFDISSRVISARVTSIRRVNWSDSRSGGFMFVFSPETLAGAPHSYIALIKTPIESRARALFQRDLASAFPNLSAIDMQEVLRIIKEVIAHVALAISVVGAVAFFSGTLILIGAVAMTKFQRIYEVAVFKTLGANSRDIVTMLAIEYGVLGMLAGLVGSVGAVALSWVLSHYFLQVSWGFSIGDNVFGVVVTGVVVGLVGVFSNLDVLRRRALVTLREE